MERTQLSLEKHCKESPFTWEERLKLRYCYADSNGYRKDRSPVVMGKIFQKSPTTFRREHRGVVGKTDRFQPFPRNRSNVRDTLPRWIFFVLVIAIGLSMIVVRVTFL